MWRKWLTWAIVVGLPLLAWQMIESYPRRPTRPLTVAAIRQMAALATARIRMIDSVAAETRGWVGGLNLLLDAEGEALIGTDLERAVLQDVNAEDGTATLTLPSPKVLSVAVDASRTRASYFSAYGLWCVSPPYEPARANLLQRATREAEQRFRIAAGSPDHLHAARRHAEDVLQRFAAAQGWTLTIAWSGN